MSDVSSVPSRPQSPDNLLPPSRPYRFTWDPASRRPGPESVSGTTEGRGGDDFGGPHPTLTLGLFNNSTTSLALQSLPTEWSSSRTGFHAISTVLNNPHKRQAPPKAHSTLPGVAAADLPRVRRKDFESYLRAIAPEWERYEQNLELGQEGQAHLDANLSTPRNSIGAGEPFAASRQSNQIDSQRGKYIPPLDSVPAIFFEKTFNLGDPRTFSNVTEQDATVALVAPQDDSFADPFSLSHSLPLLEKFSHYADTVEQHLVREISIRSTSFFAALTNLHDLQTESEHCLDRISKLRTQLQDVDKNSARAGLEMVRKECKLANLSEVRDGVRMIGGVVEMTGVAKGLVSAGQWGEALDIIEEIDKLRQVEEPEPESAALEHPRALHNGNGNGHSGLNSLPPTPEDFPEVPETEESQTTKRLPHQHAIALSSLHSFSALPSHLRVLTMEIAASLSSELVSVLRSDLEIRINDDRKADADADPDQGLRDRLKPLLLNLIRTRGLKEGMLSWREAVLIEVRGVIKKILPAFEPDEDENESREASQSEARAGLADHLRSMQHLDFVSLIQKVYSSLLNGVQGLHAQGNVIVDVLESLKSHLHQKLTDTPSLQEDLADIISSSAELSNIQAAKVISYRAEQHAALELADFLVFFNDSWAFVVKCEVLSRRMIVGLRGTVVGQAKLFLQSFHQLRISRSAKLVEDELWNPAEVTPGLQHITNMLIDSAVRDPPDLIIKSDDTIFSPVTTNFPSPSPTTSNGTSAIVQSFSNALSKLSSSNGSTAPIATSTSSKHLRIEDRSYYAVSATAEVLTLLVDYLKVVMNLSMLTTDAMSRVIEFLKSFNSRTCQVVLGAGAMRSAGLKNITAKHLALASQSLSIVFELIPYIRETFRRHLSQKQAVMLVEFDKLKRDYQEHQNEIHSKLVAIMGDRLNSHIKSLKSVDWTVPKPGGGVNEYMEILVKETATLHKVLSRYLAPSVVEYVMTQVFAAINHRLSEEYAAIDLPDQEAKSRLLADAKYLQQKLSVLKNVGTSTSMLETVIAEKNVHRANATSGPSTPTRSNTLSANQRLKGLLSGKSSTFDRTLPIPNTASPPPVPSSADKPRSSAPTTTNNNYDHHQDMDRDRPTNESQVSLGMSLSPPIQKPTALPDQGLTGAGFKQVELSSSNTPSEAHLRELKDMGASSQSGGPPPLPSTILGGGPMGPKDK